ncbi:LysE family translocator [Hyphomicrobiales bacterium]|uniref:LysE family translocator n=1 Tax=Ensifer sp. R-19 TaxID=3404055 RepID=UPI000DDF171E
MDPFILGAATLLPFLLTSFIIELTPGPNMAYLAMVAASEGRRPGMATVAGVALGPALVGFAASFGVAEFVGQSDMLYGALRWAGVGFLLYLAFDAWNGNGEEAGPSGKPVSFYFRRGLITNLLNPKAALFFVTVLPTFVDDARPLLPQNLTLAAIYVGVATAVHAAIVLLAGALEPVLNSPSRERLVRRVLALMLAAVAIWFGWSTRR